jgi:hypothetical protein
MRVRRLDHVLLAMPAGREANARKFYRDAGYAIAHDKPLEGYDRILVDDPFGNRIELMQIKPS